MGWEKARKAAYDAAHYPAWYAAHREERRAKSAAYHAVHRAERAAYYAARNAVRRPDVAARDATRKFGERVPLGVWCAVWYGSCFGCGKTPAEGVDHIIPKCRGGRNVPGNLQPGCLSCNKKKGGRERGVKS